MKLLNVLVVILYSKLSLANVNVWNYREHGPDEWPKEFPQCGGKQQSPIDLDTTIAQFNKDLKPINFNNYDQNLLWNITNDGKSIYGRMINPSLIPSINGSNYRETFNLIQFHFHWGFNPYQGSEHRLNGSKYPLEIHLVHQSESGNLAVIGFFYRLGRTNVKLKEILDAAGQTIFKNDMIAINLNLVHILPDFDEANKNGYFRYMGSLTIPPCTEGLIWTVFRQTVSISENQLVKFYSNKLESNHRDVQPLNGRILQISVRTSNSRLPPLKQQQQHKYFQLSQQNVRKLSAATNQQLQAQN
ncbi:unnamed protein product [Brachionus calyciflorus]|uniref:Carbonic anhydrase n=1 Tax=Brachionus calyciflorus TaxID=104777 RepID=A0A813NNC5_9BILA|nr:unnamed protein product [Brachionus calyciflorus]